MAALPKRKKNIMAIARTRSPESQFIRTGKIPEGLDPNRAKQLGERFLSRTWQQSAVREKAKLPVPSQRQRISGGTLPKADREKVGEQVDFMVGIFGKRMDLTKRRELKARILQQITRQSLSIRSVLTEETRGSDLKQMRRSGKSLYGYLKDFGEIYPAMTQETTGRVYLAKGWSAQRSIQTTPVHETLHVLQKLGVIKDDVPFAQVADRLYGLEKGIFKVDRRIKSPTSSEFDRKPSRVLKTGGLAEPDWVYPHGDKLGQWVFTNLRPAQRWNYLFQRCQGLTHQQALRATRLAAQ